MNIVCSRLECRNNILDWRLKQSNNVGNEFFFALESSKCLKLICAIETTFCISSLKSLDTRLRIVFQHLARNVGNFGKQYRGSTLQRVIQRGEINLGSLQSLVKKSILHSNHLHILLEAKTTETCSLLCIKPLCVYNVEMRILCKEFTQICYNYVFIFFSHD